MVHLKFVDAANYNKVINAHLERGRFEVAHSLLQGLAASGVPANKRTNNSFSIMLCVVLRHVYSPLWGFCIPQTRYVEDKI